MHKLINKKVAFTLITIGCVLAVTGFVVMYFGLFQVYGKVPCINETVTCNVDAEIRLTRIGQIGVVGGIIFGMLGAANMVWVEIRHKPKA